jgi:hypothetical protein
MCVQAAQKQNAARVAPPSVPPNKEITLHRQNNSQAAMFTVMIQ